MQPSIPATLKPGLDRGVLWDCDLFTFVTSAAGHMMRTLQKPRKNRPSKRQVNHRRFLHNMIQRKFADIEASNQRLASALYPTVEKNSQEPDTTDTSQNAGAPSNQRATGVVLKSKDAVCNKSKERRAEQASKRHKLVEILTAESPTNNKGGFHGDPGEDAASEPPPRSSQTASAEPESTHRDSVAVDGDLQMDDSPTFSPELHLLSLDYCNFPDIAEKTEMHGDEWESQWADVVDLFGIGSSSSSSSSSNNNVGGFFDIEAYFESICSCKSDSREQTVDSQPLGGSSDRWEETCRNDGDVEVTVTPEGTYGGASSFPQVDRQTVCIESQQPTAESHDPTAHSSTQDPQASCTLTANQHFNFEGVAQSFSVPTHIQQCSIPTPPPHEDDWLFTYILKDRASSDFWE